MEKCEFCNGTGKSSYVDINNEDAEDGIQPWIDCLCPDCDGLGKIKRIKLWVKPTKII